MPAGIVYEGRLFRLGVGDLIFYGVVMCRAAMHDFVVWSTTGLAVLAGLAVTILITANSDAVSQPALPIAVTLSIITLFVMKAAVEPFVVEAAGMGYYV
jgi:hypothetical protein